MKKKRERERVILTFIKWLPRPLLPKLGKYIGILRWFSRLELSGCILSVKAISMGTSYSFLYRVPCQAVNMPRPRNTICIYYMYIFILQQKSLNNACQYYKQTVFNYWFLLATLQQYLLWAANFNSIYMYICMYTVRPRSSGPFYMVIYYTK